MATVEAYIERLARSYTLALIEFEEFMTRFDGRKKNSA